MPKSPVLSFLSGVLLATITGASAAAANGVPPTGEWIASHGMSPDGAACAACHGADGAGQPEVGIPRLAGLSASYIDQQLGYFASGRRANVVMKPYAAALDETQRQAVAAYFASLSSQVAEDPIAPPSAALVRGGSLFENGDARTGLLGCSQCHGPSGLGVGDFSPRLAGQSSTYIVDQLRTWHDGSQRDPKGVYMKAIASHLSPADMQAVAAYAATLDPNKEAKP